MLSCGPLLEVTVMIVWRVFERLRGIRTQPCEAGPLGTLVSPWMAKEVPMKNTGVHITPSGTVTWPGMKECARYVPVGVVAIWQPWLSQKREGPALEMGLISAMLWVLYETRTWPVSLRF